MHQLVKGTLVTGARQVSRVWKGYYKQLLNIKNEKKPELTELLVRCKNNRSRRRGEDKNTNNEHREDCCSGRIVTGRGESNQTFGITWLDGMLISAGTCVIVPIWQRKRTSMINTFLVVSNGGNLHKSKKAQS